MAFKPFSKKKDDATGLTIDDLITLERYEDAKSRLHNLLEKRPNDLHAHLRLGDVYLRLKDLDSAREQYVNVCQSYSRDGFYDRAVAVLARVGRYFPNDDKLATLLAQLERAQRLEVVRGTARDVYLQTRDSGGSSNEAIDFVKIWESVSRSSFADRFSTEEVVLWFRFSSTTVLKRGHTLVERGDSDPRAFVIALGELEARSAGTESILRSFSVGDVVGEWALLEGKPWAADYVAPTGATLLALDAEGLDGAIKGAAAGASFKDRVSSQHHDLDVARSARKAEG